MRSGPDSPANEIASVSYPDTSLPGTHDPTLVPCARAESLNRVWPFVPMLREFVGRRVSANDVEDIVQESLVRVWRRDGDGPIEHPKSYLLRIATAVIVDRSRRARTRRLKLHCGLEERHHPNDALSPHRILLGREQLTIFMRGFEQLPKRTRAIIIAIRMDGQSFKSVAERFGISVSAVEKQVTNALRVLSAQLKEAERVAASLRPSAARLVVQRNATEQPTGRRANPDMRRKDSAHIRG